VRLSVFPPAVRIEVAGRQVAPREALTLTPGSYRVTLTHPGCSECSPDIRSLVVPATAAGREPEPIEQHFVFERRLDALAPATLLVRCDGGAYVVDTGGRRFECNVVHALPVRSLEPELITLTAHLADGSVLKQKQFNLKTNSPIVWSL